MCLFAQDVEIPNPGSPLVVDEFAQLPCDEFLGRMDNFFYQIEKIPEKSAEMIGIAFISIDPKQKYKSVIAQQTMENYIRLRRFPKDKIKIVRTNTDQDLYFRFWIWASDAALPDFGKIDDSLVFPSDLAKPFLLTTEDEFEACPDDRSQPFSDFLKANPGSRGNIVIRKSSTRAAAKMMKDLSKSMTEKYKISRDRLRFFLVKPDPNSPNLPTIEYWYLP